MICIYHNRDLDGFCSAAIIKKRFPHAKLVGYDYGQPVPWDEIPENEPVIMIDVSLPMETMAQLAQYSNWQLTWIDHHKSAINEYEKFVGNGESFCKAVLQDGIAACEIAWSYFFPDDPMPESVKLLGEYDTWRNQDEYRWENYILPFQWGMRIDCNSPETFPEVALSDKNFVYAAIYQGEIALKYQDMVNEGNCKRNAFEIEFEGLRAICLNGGPFNSNTFKSVFDPEKHDIMMPFQFNGKFWTISLYSDKEEIDCSVIAKKHGGGGHKGAAGFQVDDIGYVL